MAGQAKSQKVGLLVQDTFAERAKRVRQAGRLAEPSAFLSSGRFASGPTT
jgi:hypothetical protein